MPQSVVLCLTIYAEEFKQAITREINYNNVDPQQFVRSLDTKLTEYNNERVHFFPILEEEEVTPLLLVDDRLFLWATNFKAPYRTNLIVELDDVAVADRVFEEYMKIAELLDIPAFLTSLEEYLKSFNSVRTG